MGVRTVPVMMPDTTWGRLATLADVQGVRVEDVIANALEHLVKDLRPPLAVLHDELNAARGDGFRVPRRGRK